MLACGGGSADTGAMDTGSDSQHAETQPGDGDGDSAQACTPELESLRTELFAPSCALAACHTTADAAGGPISSSPISRPSSSARRRAPATAGSA
jgi:hypothetical protein